MPDRSNNRLRSWLMPIRAAIAIACIATVAAGLGAASADGATRKCGTVTMSGIYNGKWRVGVAAGRTSCDRAVTLTKRTIRRWDKFNAETFRIRLGKRRWRCQIGDYGQPDIDCARGDGRARVESPNVYFS